PQDPVFGGPVCQVPGCRRPGRSVGMCTAHHLRWSHAGKPSLDRFAAATSPGFTPPPLARCQAPGCGHGVAQNGLCPWHRGAWKRAGYPDLRQWLAGLPAVELTSLPPVCPVPDCELWVQGSTPFCWRHGRHWISRGRPAVSEFIASSHRQETLPAYERIDLRPLEPQLKLEMQYALQRRRDDETIKTRPSTVRGIVRFLAASGVTSLLDWPEATWKERFPVPGPKSTTRSALVIYARRRIEELAVGRGWDIEYPRDIWRLRSLGIDGQHATLSFAAIPQKDLAKRWAPGRAWHSQDGPTALLRGHARERLSLGRRASSLHRSAATRHRRLSTAPKERPAPHRRADPGPAPGRGDFAPS
ncbi:MAG TPA: hypothetical protein VIV12_04875, partial [Streptosporangiaceae bacterium]